MEFVGHIILKNPLPCHNSCLNKKIKIKIGQYEGYLYTPVLKKTDLQENSNILSEPFKKSTVNFNDNVFWGKEIDSGEHISSIETVKFIFTIEDEDFEKNQDRFIDDTDNWIKRFEENMFPNFWLKYLNPLRVTGELENNFTYYFKNSNQNTCNLGKNEIPHITFSILSMGIDLNLFKKTIELSNQNKKLTIDYRLLRDAHTYFLTGEFRESILFIGTCLDILLNILVIKRLPTNSIELKEWIMKNNKTVDKKIQIINKFGPKILELNEVYIKISDVRNKVIHDGYEPTETECLIAYELIRKLMTTNQKNKFI